MMDHKQHKVPTGYACTNDWRKSGTKNKNGAVQVTGCFVRFKPPNVRPVTRKSNGQTNGKSASPTIGSTAVKQQLQYGNGTLVDGKKLTELQTYRQYLTEKQSAPTSKTALLDFTGSGRRWWLVNWVAHALG
jgi:hypothetical protein